MRRVLLFAAVLAAAGCSSGPEKDKTEDPAWRDAEAAYLAGDWSVAIAAYDRFVVAHPDDDRVISAKLHVGRAYLAMGRAASALPYLDQVLTAGPSKAQKADAHEARGIAHIQLGDPKKAEEELLDAIRIGEDEIAKDECLYYLGVARIRQGDWNDGLDDMGAVIKANPGSNYAAKARALRAGDRAFAVQAGAFNDPAGARRRADELRAKGYDAQMVPEGAFTCVRVGKYATWREAAEAARAMEQVTGTEAAAVP